MRLAFEAAVATLGPAVRLLLPCRSEGLEHVPRRGAVLLASNHESYVDPVLMVAAVRRPVHFLGKTEFLDHPLTAPLFRDLLGPHFPVDRLGGRDSHNQEALAGARAELEAGEAVGIYPEGTRGEGGVGRGHTGVARLALATGAPVIPVGLSGAGEILANEGPWLLRWNPLARCRQLFGPPVDLEPWRSRPRDPRAWREATDAVMAAIARLRGEAYDAASAPDHVERRYGRRPPG